MRVNVTNISGKLLSTSVGSIEPATTASFDLLPDKMFRVAAELEAQRVLGNLTYRVSDSPAIANGLEFATQEVAGSRSADVTILPAAMKTLNATPVTLVPAPGAGLALIFEGMLVSMTYGTAVYSDVAAGEDLAVKYTGTAGAVVGALEATGMFDQSSSQLRWVYPGATSAFLPSTTPVANAPLVAHMLVGEIGTTTGDSPVKFRVFYRVVPSSI